MEPNILNPDLSYGLFCFGAFLITVHSLWGAWRSKKAGGISRWFPLYFAAWGATNLFVFPFSTMPIAFSSNVISVIANLLYMVIIIRNERLEEVFQNKLLP